MSKSFDKNTEHLLIGMTGGIGSGKSTVASLFEDLGARIIDTDIISHQLTQSGGAAIPSIRKEFGDDLIDASGALDRIKMRELIFSNASAKMKLEAILHPAILNETKRLVTLKTAAPYTLVVVPLLFESSNYLHWLHRSLVVDCPEASQIDRTMLRSGLDLTGVEKIMSKQIPRKQRLSMADDILTNDSNLEALTLKVNLLHHYFLSIVA